MNFPVGTKVLVNGTEEGTVMRDTGKPKLMVKVGKNAEWVERSLVKAAASYLAPNEEPGPANRAYSGVMQERLERRTK